MRKFKTIEVGNLVYQWINNKYNVLRVEHLERTDDLITVTFRPLFDFKFHDANNDNKLFEVYINNEMGELDMLICNSLDTNAVVTYSFEPSFLQTDIPATGPGLYIHNKTGNPYELLTDEFMFKDHSRKIDFSTGIIGVIPTELNWRKHLCLYRTHYKNKDSDYFSRNRDDFYQNFTRVL